jgi:hypothetical protein
VAVNPRVRSEMSGSEEKIDGCDYHVRERCASESWMMYYLGGRYIYIGLPPRNPRVWGCARGGRSDHLGAGLTVRGGGVGKP